MKLVKSYHKAFKTRLELSGEMNEQDAGTAGVILAKAALAFSRYAGLSLLVAVVKWW